MEMLCNATITTPSPVVPQSLVLKTSNNYDTGQCISPLCYRLLQPQVQSRGMNQSFSVCLYIRHNFITKIGLRVERLGSGGRGKWGGALRVAVPHNILTQLKNVISDINTCEPQKKMHLEKRSPSEFFLTSKQHPFL